MGRVLVTGATGFVGRALCPALVKAGHSVVRVLRREGAAPVTGCEDVVVGDIGPQTDWAEVLHGCDTVVHLAARVHVMAESAKNPETLYRAINTEGTRALAEAAAAANVRRFIYLSSVKAHGEASGYRPLRETDPPVPVDAYGRSKLAAEQALFAAAEGTTMAAVALRPPLVYGPGVKGNFLRLLGLVDRGVPLPLATTDNRRSLLFLGNLIDGVLRVVAHDAPASGAYFLCDGPAPSTPQLISAIARALGRPARLFPAPVALLRLVGAMAGKGETVSRLVDSLEVDHSAFCAAFGWTPPFDMAEGLRDTAVWRRNGRDELR